MTPAQRLAAKRKFLAVLKRDGHIPLPQLGKQIMDSMRRAFPEAKTVNIDGKVFRL